MPRIAAVATALPPHRITQAEAKAFARAHFGGARRDIDRLLDAFDHTGIESRYVCMEPSWYAAPHDFGEKNKLYIDWSTRLGANVARDCLDKAGISPAEVTHIIFVSTTGLATPSIDSRLVNVLGLCPHVRRTPLWGLGCGGGAAGLSHAAMMARADAHACVLLVSVELCSLTFHHADTSKSNVIATALFADGAAGVLVTGEAIPGGGPEIAGEQATTWPGSLDVMGWNFDSVGMQVVFSRAIPAIVQEKVRDDVDRFLVSQGTTLAGVPHLIAHPGGAKVIEAYEKALALPCETMRLTREILRDFGNMSSPSVLFVLERFLAQKQAGPGERALLTALGPGFTSEKLILQF
ncbi:MAG: 3-oxoacyl-[acyl-carrier-protein] synthase III C-terminal domain-containing protein [Candidatus Zixiibacteriota bacterium]